MLGEEDREYEVKSESMYYLIKIGFLETKSL